MGDTTGRETSFSYNPGGSRSVDGGSFGEGWGGPWSSVPTATPVTTPSSTGATRGFSAVSRWRTTDVRGPGRGTTLSTSTGAVRRVSGVCKDTGVRDWTRPVSRYQPRLPLYKTSLQTRNRVRDEGGPSKGTGGSGESRSVIRGRSVRTWGVFVYVSAGPHH